MAESAVPGSDDSSFPLMDDFYNGSGRAGNVTLFLPEHTGNGSNVSEPVHIFHSLATTPEAYVIPILFSLIFVTGLVGNGTLIYTVLRNKNMRNTPNIFIVSLALGDFLLIAVSVPFNATIYTFNEWPYGQAMCKINEFLQTLSLGVSIFTLTALSGDRYTAIMYPMSIHKSNSQLRTILIAAVIWILAIVLAIPDLIAAHVTGDHVHGIRLCTSYPTSWGAWYPKFHAMWRFVVYFALPLVIIGIFYVMMATVLIHTASHMPGESQSGQGRKQMEARKKVAKMVLSFVLVFVVCWLPRHVFTLWYHFDPNPYNLFWHIFKIIGFCLMFLNSCINPLALYYLSNQFRRYYDSYLLCCFRSGAGSRGRRTLVAGGDHTTHSGHAYTTMRRNSGTLMTTQLTVTDSKI